MPRRLNQIVDVLTRGFIVIFSIAVLIPVSSVVKMLRISVGVEYIRIAVLHKTQPSTKPTASIQRLCAGKFLDISFKGLYRSLIFLQDC